MTDLQKRFLELAKKYETMKDEMDKIREELTSSMNSLGLNAFIQDPETNVVYQVIEPTGVFTYFKKIDYVRTKKGEERAGSLSMKKAEEAGFKLSK